MEACLQNWSTFGTPMQFGLSHQILIMQLRNNYTYFQNDFIHLHFQTDNNWDEWVFDLDSTNGMPPHSVICECLVSLQCPSIEIIQGKSCQNHARFWHIINGIYWYLYYIGIKIIIVYNNQVILRGIRLEYSSFMMSWFSVPSPADAYCNSNAIVTSKQRCDAILV